MAPEPVSPSEMPLPMAVGILFGRVGAAEDRITQMDKRFDVIDGKLDAIADALSKASARRQMGDSLATWARWAITPIAALVAWLLGQFHLLTPPGGH